MSSSSAPRNLAFEIVESPNPEEVGRELVFAASRVTIGRRRDCDLSLADVGVSGHHADVVVEDGNVVLVDRESSNGTWVGEERVGRQELGSGQRFRVGATVIGVAFEGRLERAPPPAETVTEEESGAPEPEIAPEPPAVIRSPEPIAESGEALDGLLAEGQRVAASGNRPFLLGDPETVWVVESGKVEIFTVGVEDERPVGARRHYLSVEPGEAFFGMDLERYAMGSGFLAVGRMGSTLRQIPITRLRELAAREDRREEVAALVDRWVLGLAQSLTKEIVPAPLVDVGLGGDDEVSLERGQKARANKGVLWLEVERGELLYIGMEEIAPTAQELFPVTPRSWIEASNEYGVHTDLTVAPTVEVVGRPDLWSGLALFHATLCQCEFINKRLAVVDQFNRLRSKAEYSRAAEEMALKKLASVLKIEEAEIPIVTDAAEGELVVAAMSLIGSDLALEVRKPHESLEESAYDEQVTMIAKASGFRGRVVILREGWWQKDLGPVLARREEGGDPVALLPRGPRSYEIVDPAAGTREAVTEELAAGLEARAYVFYRPFSEGALKPLDLVRFGARGLGRDFLTLVFMGIAVGILGALTPYFTGKVFDSAIPQAERGLLTQFVLALAVAALAGAAFKLTQAIAVLRVQGKMDYSIQAALWDRLLMLPSTFFRDFSAGDLADRASGINAIRGLVSGSGVSAILGSFSSIFYLGLMFTYSSGLTLVAIVLTFLFVGFTTAANLLQLRHQRDQFERRGRITGLILQLITGVGKLRVGGAENHAFRIWSERFSDHRRVSFKIGRIQNSVAVFNSSFPIFSSMAIFYFLMSAQEKAQVLGSSSNLTTGEFIAFSAAYGLFLAAMQALSDASLQMLQVIPIYERLKPIVTTPAEIDETKAHPGILSGEIELSHLHFRYDTDGPWIIRDLSLTIQPGEFVAFVGSSGSGKSTVMRLMLGFETPEKGSVYYDGQDLGNLDLQALRQQLGVVLQESRVLPTDIFRNIIGQTSKTIDDAWEAARMAGLEEDIRQMPMGMHTYVSEGGGGFSGGQRQRLLIARALVNRPRIIFMDEATSALDNRTQAMVTESLDRLQATRIVIAHRLSTIMNADRICYLDGGAIKESGSYEELMEEDGLFAELARRQMA